MTPDHIPALLAEAREWDREFCEVAPNSAAENIRRLSAALAAEHERAEDSRREHGIVSNALLKASADREALALKLAEAEERAVELEAQAIASGVRCMELTGGNRLLTERCDALARQVEAMRSALDRIEGWLVTRCISSAEDFAAGADEMLAALTDAREAT